MIKTDTLLILGFVVFLIWISSCANPTQPTGGPKDTIPPVLINVDPPHESLNFDDDKVKLTFDEYIKVENITQNLIITPRLEKDFEFLVNKNTLTITFPEPLDSATTYTLNFTESVVDITESNPSTNLVVAFSTGNYIDSLAVSGQVKNLFTNKPIERATVVIYKAADTLDIFNSKPDYFTRTDVEGYYTISNIKNGQYKIYAYLDKNSNLLAEPLDEPYGFLSEPLDLSRSIDSLQIPIQKLDVREFKMRSARPAGKYFEITFNKYVEDYHLTFKGNDSLPSNLIEQNKKIRVYNSINLTDSVEAAVNAIDTIGQAIDTSFYIKFGESQRKLADITVTVEPASGKKIEEDFTAEIKFSKPVATVSSDTMVIEYDSLTIVPVTPAEDFTWNKFRDHLTIEKQLDKSLLNRVDSSALADTLTAPADSLQPRNTPPAQKIPDKDVTMFLAEGSFITVDNDTVKEIKATYEFINPEDFGIIRGFIETDEESFIVQLMDKSYNVVREITTRQNYTLRNVPPGEYTVRILIDNNNNGVWEPGNIKLNQQPEDIIFFPETISIRANWELEDVNFNF